MAGSGIPRISGSFATAAAYTTLGRHKACYLTDDFTVTRSTGATVPSIGIMEDNAAEAGAAVEVTVHGETQAKLGGTVTVGAFLVPDANGDLVAITVADEGTVNYYVARALEGGDDDDIIKVFVCPGYTNVA